MDLLPQHRALLQVDYEALAKGPTVDRQYWIAQLESAIISRKRNIFGNTDEANTSKKRKFMVETD